MIKEEGKHFHKITIPIEDTLTLENFAFLSQEPFFFKTPAINNKDDNQSERFFLGLHKIDFLNENEAPYFTQCCFFEDPKSFQFKVTFHWTDKTLYIFHLKDLALEKLIGLSAKDLLSKIKTPSSPKVFATKGKLLSIKPSSESWNKRVKEALERSELKKIVLSQAYEFSLEGETQPFQIFLGLERQQGLFSIFWDGFISFSPESLFHIRDGKVLLEAIAGTRPNEEHYYHELETDIKESREHNDVVEEIEHALSPLGDVHVGEREILALKSLIHLRTPLELQARGVTSQNFITTLIKKLHPTPAVGGRPQSVAMKLLKEWEPTRKKYAGILCATWDEDSHAAVLIRSFQLEPQKLIAYAGAGIVMGSIPEKESREIEHKIKSFIPENFFEFS